MKATEEYEYGPEAQTERDYKSLSQKQQQVVKAVVRSDPDDPRRVIADDAGLFRVLRPLRRDQFPSYH